MLIPVEPVDYGMEDYNGDKAKANVADGGTWIAPVQYVVDEGVARRICSTRAVVHDAEGRVTANQIHRHFRVSLKRDTVVSKTVGISVQTYMIPSVTGM